MRILATRCRLCSLIKAVLLPLRPVIDNIFGFDSDGYAYAYNECTYAYGQPREPQGCSVRPDIRHSRVWIATF